jgi:hypothetical protein
MRSWCSCGVEPPIDQRACDALAGDRAAIVIDDLIIHGRSIVQRLTAEAQMTPEQRAELPDTERVPVREANGWEDGVCEAAAAHRSTYPERRIQAARDRHRDQITAGTGTELTRMRDFYATLLQVVEDLAASESGSNQVASADRGARTPSVPTDGRDVFLSHASEDKEFVRSLARALGAVGVSVWLDEAEIELGDSIGRAIDDGLRRSRYAVLVLSHAFFAKQWPRRELDALEARETSNGEKAILPVWLGVSAGDVLGYSPMLASRLAANGADGVEGVAAAVARVVQRPGR